jgi:hypothetical protein
VEKYDGARGATDKNIIRRMRITCWITKATDKHSEYERKTEARFGESRKSGKTWSEVKRLAGESKNNNNNTCYSGSY